MNASKKTIHKYIWVLSIILILLLPSAFGFVNENRFEDSNKTVHILFLHGMPETPNVLMPLKGKIEELFAEKETLLDYWYPHLPDSESVDTWAGNVADEITEWNPADDIVIVGLSMGGKVAVHLTANERYGVQDRIDSVITINSPLKSFNQFYNAFFGYSYPTFLLPFMGTAVMNYSTPNGFIDVITFDSSSEANWIASEKSLLTFVSGEQSPADTQFDGGFGDMFPRVIDDGTVPMPAQYTSKTTTVYYGIKEHEAVFRDLSINGACDTIAYTIVDFLCGKPVKSASLLSSGDMLISPGLIDKSPVFVQVAENNTCNQSRNHFEIRLGPDTSWFNQAEVNGQWIVENKTNPAVLLSISNMFPFFDVDISWKVFEEKSVSRSSYFSS